MNKKKLLFFIIYFLLTLICLKPRTSEAESNIDFFFKNSNKYENVTVRKVLRTDMIQLENRKIIHLIGLRGSKPPKKKIEEEEEADMYGITIPKKTSPIHSFEERSIEEVEDLLEGQTVRLEFDVSFKDDDFNTVAYVFLVDNDLFVNAEILRRGLAQLSISPPNTKYEKELRAAYQEARTEKRGLHNQ